MTETGRGMEHPDRQSGELALRYLRGRLTGDEAERFEEHLLVCAECVHDLELLERFDRAVKGVAVEDALRLGLWARLRRRWTGAAGRPLAAVAVVALLATTLFLGWRGETLEDALRAARAPVANPLVVRLSPTRAVGGDPAVTLHPRPGAAWVVLELDASALVDRRVPGPLRAALVAAGGEVVLEVAELEAGPDGGVTLALPVGELADGDYRLELRGAGSARLVFPFRWAGPAG